MAQNTITLHFDECEPTPANGYKITYRPVGSVGPYRIWPNVFTTPAVIVDDNDDPVGTDYEGFIEGDCGGGKFGVPVPWTAENVQSVSFSQSPNPSQSESIPPSFCGGVCGRYKATGEAEAGAAFSWVDCDGNPGATVIAFNDEFEFCTCDDDPQYSTDNVTVARQGVCSDAHTVRMGDGTVGLCDSAPATVYTAHGGTIAIGQFIYFDAELTMPVDSFFYVIAGGTGGPGTIYEVDTSGEIVADSGLSCP